MSKKIILLMLMMSPPAMSWGHGLEETLVQNGYDRFASCSNSKFTGLNLTVLNSRDISKDDSFIVFSYTDEVLPLLKK